MSVQDTARAIFKQWAEQHDAASDLPDKLLDALKAEYFREAADEVAAMPLPTAVMATGGPLAQATRRGLNDASKRLQRVADQGVVKCPPGVHSSFDPCPGTCTLPVIDC